jgi:hypothetical protein
MQDGTERQSQKDVVAGVAGSGGQAPEEARTDGGKPPADATGSDRTSDRLTGPPPSDSALDDATNAVNDPGPSS